MRPVVVSLLSLILAACQIGSPSTDAQLSTTDVTPSTQPSAASSASSMAPPSATPLASSTASPTLKPGPDALPPGSQAVVLVRALKLRDDPSLAGGVKTTMPAGEVVYLIGPPFQVSADGYVWRLVAYAAGYRGWPVNPDTTWFGGWAAASGPDGSLLDPVPASCPDDPVTLNKLIRLPEWDRARCFGDRELTFRGRVVTGFGGYIEGSFEPSWLAHPIAFAGAFGTDVGYLTYRRRSGIHDEYVEGDLLEVTGHFSDPAAQRCTVAVGEPPIPEPDDLAIAYCQGQFVVTSVRHSDG